ncbi:hypothetical protein TV39_08410 [Arthrobacter sp. SPG23]|uniref:hypothetical protein n=1 Tax=Arthrobacter sp. SPG23 TaxID=1610703 RepID=UPI0005BC1FD8|nr:hypothetical protein [Arthrobacter sp. SPG23]KIS27767.1 hypothetical protein TV39_08410 [Arthrobacter sp. SPG23]
MADPAGQYPQPELSIGGLPERGRVLCRGFIESVTYVPATQVATFTAIVMDHDLPRTKRGPAPAGTEPRSSRKPGGPGRRDRLRVVWLGRRRVPGVDPGCELRLEGMLTVRDGLPTMFNPRYEILSRQENQ